MRLARSPMGERACYKGDGMKSKAYRAILLDVDDTLLDFARCSQGALAATCASLGLPYDSRVYAWFRQIDAELWAAQKRGRISVEEVLNLRAERLLERLGSGLRGIAFRRGFQEYLAREAERTPHALETVHRLSGDYSLYAASNGILAMQRSRLELAGLLGKLRGVFVSDDIGYEKPDPRFFRACLERSGADASSTLMVGDSLEADMRGAAGCGIDTCWYNPLGLPDGIGCCYMIADLTQLGEILLGER